MAKSWAELKREKKRDAEYTVKDKPNNEKTYTAGSRDVYLILGGCLLIAWMAG